MTFSLTVDAERWRRHHRTVLDDVPGLVPVVKGNGYGFGLERLGAEATRMGVDTVAVGLPEEVAPVRSAFDGSVLVLTPFHPATTDAPHDAHVVRTVAHLEALRVLAGTGEKPRVVLELATSMRRHGLDDDELAQVGPLLSGVTLEGWALHLPLTGGHLPEAQAAVTRLRSVGLPVETLWVSHLSADEIRSLGAGGVTVRPRVGTRLWLGDPEVSVARGTVLDSSSLARGDRFGYRQQRARAAGTLLIISGGTSHGVGMEAPKPVSGPVARGKVLAMGALGAAGRSLSPFRVAGRRRWFAEPPHMQVSMLLLPHGVAVPAIGDQLDCVVRMTTVTFDRVHLH